MTEVALWLLVVGLCDLVRAARDATSGVRRLLVVGLGVALLVVAAASTDLLGVGHGLLFLGWIVALAMWVLGSAQSLVSKGAVSRAVAFVGLAGGVVGSLLAGDVEGVEGYGPGALAGVPNQHLLLVSAVLVVQLSTANLLVRLVLDAVGVPAAPNEKQLKGGRLLGPMERVFIVGLGLAGELTAASIVVAAKGLLRFPELQRGAGASGPTDLTEYFLIGTLASWLVALGSLTLLALGLQ
jgi:hypothetical protein